MARYRATILSTGPFTGDLREQPETILQGSVEEHEDSVSGIPGLVPLAIPPSRVVAASRFSQRKYR